ncbi:MAG TPA: efflux RND transporter periplasmic adaptor subunit [Alphaproteobacteria bacterium]
MKRIKGSWLLAGAILLGAAAWLLSGQLAGNDRNAPTAARETATAPEEAVLPSVRVVESVARPHAEIIRVLGHTEAWRTVELRVETDGRVVELPIARGRPVRAGDVVVRLATEDRMARLQEAQALLRQRQIEHDAAKQLNVRGYRSETALAEAAARLDAARATLKRIEVELGHTVLHAPFEGVLDVRPVELGSYVKAGDHIGTIVDLDPLRVVGFVAERDVGRVRLGMPGEAILPDGTTLKGSIAYVAAAADPATRTFRIELDVANPTGAIVAGLTAELRLPVGQLMAHEITPAVLTLNDEGIVGVKVVDDERTVAFRDVRVVGNGREGTVLLTGLPDRATIIAVGQEYAAVGQQVRTVMMAKPVLERAE